MEVKYIDHMGSDERVVQAARVSFSMDNKPYDEKKDKSLIKFLARGMSSKDFDDLIDMFIEDGINEENFMPFKHKASHFTPFTHCSITLLETVPIFIARQRFKHTVGFSYNEISRRYVDKPPTFYMPSEWRMRAENKKQGSSTEKVTEPLYVHPDGNESVSDAYSTFLEHANTLYFDMLKLGVCPEQARMVLPQSMMTSYYVTGSLAAFARAYNQRSDSHAQLEIQYLAKQWDKIIRPLFPDSWSALTS